MNINVYLEDSIGKKINNKAQALGCSRNSIIRTAIKEWLEQHKKSKWPKSIMQFKGIPDFPRFEQYRDELLPAKEDPFE